ncbi:MAG: carboxypeptidase regulatory-like domain-containing protein [Candidatus Aminicenantes bacterium]|nr:MAG: carboxypeptidase regulatory-like domain-containing protein [Candidatus Aminicenantes bacterium]
MRQRGLRNRVALLTLFLWVFLLVGFPLPGTAEEGEDTGNLKGFIYKRNGRTPLWGAQVVLKNIKTGKLFESNVTDSIGDYQLTDIPAGDYQVHIYIKNKSYKVKKVDFLVKIVPQKTTRISFAIKRPPFLFFVPFQLCKVIAFFGWIGLVIVAI